MPKRKSSLILDEVVKKMFMLTADLKGTFSHYIYTTKAPLTMSQICKEIMMRVRRHIHAIYIWKWIKIILNETH